MTEKSLIFVCSAVSLLVGCTMRIDNNSVIDAASDMARSAGRINEETVVQAFGLSPETYQRIEFNDNYASYSYKTEENKEIKQVIVDNLPHFSDTYGRKQQQIRITFSDEICITPAMIKERVGLDYKDSISPVHILKPNSAGYINIVKSGVDIYFSKTNDAIARVNLSDDEKCPKNLSIYKMWKE